MEISAARRALYLGKDSAFYVPIMHLSLELSRFNVAHDFMYN